MTAHQGLLTAAGGAQHGAERWCSWLPPVRRLVRMMTTAGTLATLIVLLTAGVASASTVDTSVVDVDSPIGQVSLAAGATGNITINLTVTGRQDAPATFKVNKAWTLSNGTFSGSNPETINVPAQTPGTSTTFSRTGTIAVANNQAHGGPFTLAVSAFDITNSGTQGRLSAGSASSYAVTVTPPADSTPPVIVPSVNGTQGSNDWYTSDVTVSWAVSDAQSTAVIDSGCATQTFTADTTAVTSSCSAHSTGGSSTNSVTVKIDKTAPMNVTLAPSGTEGAGGWYTSNVTVETSGTDATSGVSCTADQTLTDETAGQVVTGKCTNGAGLSTSATPITVKIDQSGPSAGLAVTAGTPGSNGWYTSAVTVTASGSDLMSGSVVCSSPVTLMGDTGGTVVNGSCTDAAGLTTNATSLTVKIDESNPTAELAPSGTAGANGWYTSPVSVATNGADNVSNPTLCTGPQSFTDDTTGTTVNGSCTNDAGRTQQAAAITLKIDQTAPTNVVLSVHSGTAGFNGWYTSDVVVRATGQDATSGLSCSADVSVSGETAGTSVTGYCENGAGLRTNATPLLIKIDTTPPSATLVASGTTGSNQWYTSAVTVDTVGGDEGLSNPVTCTEQRTFTADTPGTTVTGSCTNDAGLSAAATSITLKIDKMAPTNVAFVGSITNGSTFTFGSVPAAPTCTATDATSLLDVCTVSGYSTAVGSHILTATAKDNAGNQNTATMSYAVQAWQLLGFYAPVDMNTSTARVVNTVKGGSTVPLKFEVFAGSTELTTTSAIEATLRFTKVNCVTGASIEAPIETVATGGTALRYDTTSGQFIYNWKLPTGPGTCYDVVVGTLDGSAITAHFRLK